MTILESCAQHLERVRSSGIDPKQSQITSTTNIIAKNLVLIVSIVELLERVGGFLN